MKRSIISIIFCLVLCGFAFAQSPFPELDKIKQVKLLKSTHEDVKRIFAEYVDPHSTDYYDSLFITDRASILFIYSSGNCSEKDEDWNVPESKVVEIQIVIKNPIKPQDLGIDLSKLEKEKSFVNYADDFVYHNKKAGVGYRVSKDKINQINFIPSNENYSLLCNKKETKKYYLSKSWFHKKLKKRLFIRGLYANVKDLTLSVTEISAACETTNLDYNKTCIDNSKLINVSTDAESSDETDILTYNYSVSGGRIIGKGADVIWDLSGEKPGSYKITASVDNGCGICGTTRTKTVVVKECPDCSQK